jgi:hypothetical protein
MRPGRRAVCIFPFTTQFSAAAPPVAAPARAPEQVRGVPLHELHMRGSGPELSELGQTVLEGADEESGLDERVGRRAVVG